MDISKLSSGCSKGEGVTTGAQISHLVSEYFKAELCVVIGGGGGGETKGVRI